jgi:hypothetical protein
MNTMRAVLPRESGAYAELAFPLLTAFLAGGVTPAGVGFAVAVIAWFLAREPLAVISGARGKRLEAALGGQARWAAPLLGGIGAVAAVAGLAMAPPLARSWAVVPAVFGGVVAPAVLRGRPKSLGSELLVACALATVLLPIGLAGSMRSPQALLAAAAWTASFVLATLAVHAIKACHKPDFGQVWTITVTPIAAVLTGVGALLGMVTGKLPMAVGLAVLPPTIVVLAAGVLRPHPRRLKRVGWSLVAANTVTLMLLVVGR